MSGNKDAVEIATLESKRNIIRGTYRFVELLCCCCIPKRRKEDNGKGTRPDLQRPPTTPGPPPALRQVNPTAGQQVKTVFSRFFQTKIGKVSTALCLLMFSISALNVGDVFPVDLNLVQKLMISAVVGMFIAFVTLILFGILKAICCCGGLRYYVCCCCSSVASKIKDSID